MPSPYLSSSLASVAAILAAMAAVAAVEAALPLHPRGRRHRDHLAPNLALTGIAFATNALLNGALVLALAWLRANGLGLLPALAPAPPLELALVVVALDLSFYVSHVAMHAVPAFWRFHRVHHSDAAVDVTTTIRQHPGESLLRYAFLAAFALALGASPAAFAVYRLWSALHGLLEHANVRLPLRLDGLLSLVVSTPHMHKVHHAREPRYTDTNYGNLFSAFDRLFGTFTPSHVGPRVACGLDGFDDAATQTTRGLLALPFRGETRPARGAAARPDSAPLPAQGATGSSTR